ncbi:uncharacterized protein LOC123477476 [Daphnia magna]|uniref:uncharacterized protein LOC123477476 n=1 Tax=Daphnia magna TaxID=35525 RepID=UPI001E1BD6A8|nr:uncharacterized protein LOC123477476 [Daphnia magna]
MCAQSRILNNDIIEKIGVPMRVFKHVERRSQGEELLDVYRKVRADRTLPDFTGNVNFMVNREKYEAVMAHAILENAKENYNLVLRPWQSNVVQIAGQQCNRNVLWVWDYDGNSGKTELAWFFMMKMRYQLLTPGRNHDLCGLINPFAKGYVFDCAWNSFSSSGIKRVNAIYEILEDLKNNFLVSGKYKRCEKVTLNNTVIVFANQLPNLDRLSLDRWFFFSHKTWV